MLLLPSSSRLAYIKTNPLIVPSLILDYVVALALAGRKMMIS